MELSELIFSGYKQASHITFFTPYISLQTKYTTCTEGIWWALDDESQPKTIHGVAPDEAAPNDLPDSLWCKINQTSIDIVTVFEGGYIARTTHTGIAHVFWEKMLPANEATA